jgi:uncharacterized membrane protein YbhN (UPF0104 family)
VATILTLLVNVHRAWRWHYLLLPIKPIGLGTLTSATFIGWAFITLQGRVGELARPVFVARRENVSTTAALATVVLERMFDLISVLSILAVYLLFFPLPTAIDPDSAWIIPQMRLAGLASLAGLVVAATFLTAAQLAPRRTDALMVRIMGLLPGGVGDRILPLARSFLSGFAGIRSPRLTITIAVHSVLIWLNILVTYYLLLFAFDIELPYYAVMPLIVMVVIGVMVPTPAAVGSFHVATQLALTNLWGVPADAAAGYAIVCHAIVFVPITIIGIILLSREGLSLRGFESEAVDLEAS